MSAFNYWLLLKVFRSGDIYIVYIINALLMMITTMSIYFIHQSKIVSVRSCNDYNNDTNLQ